MGLQISCGIYTEEAQENDIWSDPQASWRVSAFRRFMFLPL
jgi:hypothetical protein